eukprot:6490851-Amphidinium_carterae.2
MIHFLEAIEVPDLPILIGDQRSWQRIKRLQSDRARELSSAYLEDFLKTKLHIYHTTTKSYDPQSNGTAERAVGLVKCLLCKGLGIEQHSPPLGALCDTDRDTDPPTYEVVKAANPTLCPPEAPLVSLMTEKRCEADMTDLVIGQKVAESTGEERKKWIEAARKEVKNLTDQER